MHGRVLLLNGSTWEPLDIISVPRAINLLLAQKAIVVEETGKVLRSISAQIHIPSVIALKTFINVPHRQATWSRRAVLTRDNFTCIYCLLKPGDILQGRILTKSDMTIDHILPKSRGGKDVWSNTACACYACNRRKGDQLPGEAGMKLHWEPRRPRTNYLVLEVGTGPVAWRKYIEVKSR